MAASSTISKFLASWPWQRMGTYKYHLFLPIFASAAFVRYHLGKSDRDNWYLHILVIAALRYIQYQAWTTFSRLHAVVKRHQIHSFAVNYEQVDREFDCDNGIIFQSLLLAYAIGSPDNLPIWNGLGLVYLLLFHVGATEFGYYWVHRALHANRTLFNCFHFYHHLSAVPEPATAGTHSFLEAILQTSLMSIPILGSTLLGGASLTMFYIYPSVFDFFKYMGHFNCEIVPQRAFHAFPLLKYLMYTPSYHSIHHMDLNSNFCLFMPLYDYLGGTRNPNTDTFHAIVRKGQQTTPQFVFLVHCIDIISSLHVPFSGRTVSSIPFQIQWYAWLAFPIGLVSCLVMSLWAKIFVASTYFVNGLHAESWVVPRYGFHYFIPFCANGINKLIERAILDANELGVKVISLAALNKNESLNGGGLLFVKKHKDLRVRVVHGNTLTAALVIKELPPGTREVFLTGSTSKIGRAVALYLCRRNIRVMMLTSSRERYESVRDEAPKGCGHNLVQVTKYQAGQTCKTWIVGKWATHQDQSWAPTGTHFHQFVVPPIHEYRKDCTYGKLAGMRLPPNVQGLHSCEYTFDRGVVAACHAGGLLHALEKWTHHEVGPVEVEHIDIVWEAALKHGLSPV